MLPDFSIVGLGWVIRSYGALMALALLLGWSITRRLGRADRLPLGPLSAAYVVGAIVGLAVARIAWLLQQPGTSGGHYDLLAINGDQLAPIAGLTGAGIVGGLYLARRRIPVVAGYDVAVLGLAAAAMVERLGALLAGTGFGDHAPSLPFALRFPEGSPAFLAHQQSVGGLLPPGATESLPVHPTQIYGLVLAGVALAIGLWIRRHRRYSGQVFLGTAIALLFGRAWVEEWFRADAQAAIMGPFNGAQVGALMLIVSMAVIMRARSALAQRHPERFRPWEGGRWSPRAPKSAGPTVSPDRAPPSARSASSTKSSKPSKRRGKGKGKSRSKRRKK